jgi:origin recognition complex subunit 4
MSDCFDPSPRSSKRRKFNTYGTSKSTLLENEIPASSTWDNVSNSVTGLSRRLFAGARSRKSTPAEKVLFASQEVTPTPAEVHPQGEELEIAESEDEDVVKEPTRKLRRKNPAPIPVPENPPVLVEHDDPSEGPSDEHAIKEPARKSKRKKSAPVPMPESPPPPLKHDETRDEPVEEPGQDTSEKPSEEIPKEPSEEPAELLHIKTIVLARLTHRAAHTDRPPLPSHLSNAYETLHTLLQTTISSGESNSLLLLGSRGSGKTLLVNTALDNLRRASSPDFHIVRLNGFIQTDDRLALREIWRQLGREMDVDEEETNQVVGSYADTMTSLLGLLSQPEEVPDIGAVEYAAEKVVTRSVLFVLDEFDLFTTHPRQTLLYNLFDIAQSRKAPIAVIGCSARTDCVECLEKRVKSRFSHRWVHVGQPKSLAAFEEVARESLLVTEKQVGLKKQEQEWRTKWNEHIKVSSALGMTFDCDTKMRQSTFLPSPTIQSLISSAFYTTKSLPDLLAALYIPIATATISIAPSSGGSISEPPSLLSLLPSLPHMHLALLVCATRLEAIHSLTQFNFNIVYAHYTDLLKKSKLAASASGASASGMREWGRDVALKNWEELVRWKVLVKVGGKDEGMGEDGRMYRIDVSIEEVRWAVERLGTGVGEGIVRWCKEI